MDGRPDWAIAAAGGKGREEGKKENALPASGMEARKELCLLLLGRKEWKKE